MKSKHIAIRGFPSMEDPENKWLIYKENPIKTRLTPGQPPPAFPLEMALREAQMAAKAERNIQDDRSSTICLWQIVCKMMVNYGNLTIAMANPVTLW